MKKRTLGLITLASVLTLSLAACGNSSKSSSSSSSSVNTSKFPTKTSNSKSSIKGGTLKVAFISDTAFKGIFNAELYSDNNDATMMQYAQESLFATDTNYNVKDGGAASLKLDQKAKTATITLVDNLKWSDGQPVKASDIVYAYKIVANKDSQSQRYTEDIQNVVGITDYHSGKATEISGLEVKNDKTLVIHFKVMKPSMTAAGGGIWGYAEPEHYLKDVPFKDLMASDKIRKTPMFFGPYVMSKIVSGQSVEYTPNKYYYAGAPKLSKIIQERVAPSALVASIKNHKYDIIDVSSSKYQDVKNVSGYNFLQQPSLSYSYLGFKVGKLNTKTGTIEENPDAKMNDVALRQAMGYAMNVDQVNAKFSNNIPKRATTVIPSAFKTYHDSSAKGFPLNIKKANKLLDDAGYKMGKDGYRTDKDGKKLVIKMASMSGSDTAEPIAQNYIQQWKKIGLKVELTTGRLIEMNSFYDKVQADDKNIDIFMGAWGTGTDPTPTGLYGPNDAWNFERFNQKENTKLMNELVSEKAFDIDYRTKIFKEWQEWMNKNAYVIPVNESIAITAVSNRVKNYDLTPGNDVKLSQIELTADSIPTK